MPKKRRQKDSPSRRRREAGRALERGAEAKRTIDRKARERQEAWAAETPSEPVTAEITRDLEEELYPRVREARRRFYAAYPQTEGKPYEKRRPDNVREH